MHFIIYYMYDKTKRYEMICNLLLIVITSEKVYEKRGPFTFYLKHFYTICFHIRDVSFFKINK